MARNIVTGIDIGSSFVKAIALRQEADGEYRLFGFGKSALLGMRRGSVIDPHNVSDAVRECIEQVSSQARIPIRSAIIGADGVSIGAVISNGLVMVSRADGQISQDDLVRALEAAKTQLPRNFSKNNTILESIVLRAVIDKELEAEDPVGLAGSRLEVETFNVSLVAPHFRNLVKAVELAGVRVEDVVSASLARANLLLNNKQKEVGSCLFDIGGAVSSAIIFDEGKPISIEAIPVGSDHITNDIAIGFRVTLDTAERIKKELWPQIDAEDDLVLESGQVISKKILVDIVDARLDDVFGLLNKHLKKIGRSELLPAGVVIVGGGAFLHGIAEMCRRHLKLPAEIATMPSVITQKSIRLDPSWATAQALCMSAPSNVSAHRQLPFGKLKSLLRSLLP